MKYAKDGAGGYNDILMTSKVQLEIVYASIYGETWSVKGNFSEPVKLEGLE